MLVNLGIRLIKIACLISFILFSSSALVQSGSPSQPEMEHENLQVWRPIFWNWFRLSAYWRRIFPRHLLLWSVIIKQTDWRILLQSLLKTPNVNLNPNLPGLVLVRDFPLGLDSILFKQILSTVANHTLKAPLHLVEISHQKLFVWTVASATMEEW